MARLTKFVTIAVFSMGLAASTPTSCQAGVIPWVYDAVFGPVGSLRYGAGYTPTYYAGYGNRGYSYSSYGYAPTTVAYAPYNSGCSSCSSGCSTCGQSSSYYGGYAQSYYVPNSGCASGNCSSCGGNCSGNCTSCGSAPISSSSGYVGTPTPDTQNNSIRDTLQRINDRLDRLEYEHRQHGDFLKDRHEFELKEYRGRASETYKGGGTVVTPRTREKTFTSQDQEEDFSRPFDLDRAPSRRKQPNEAQKPTLIEDKPVTKQETKNVESIQDDIPLPSESRSDEDENGIQLGAPRPHGPAPAEIEATPEARRLIERQTAKAVAPRQRAQTTTSTSTPKSGTAVASKPRGKSSSKVRLDSSLNSGLSRN